MQSIAHDSHELPTRDELVALYDSVGWSTYTGDLDYPIRTFVQFA